MTQSFRTLPVFSLWPCKFLVVFDLFCSAFTSLAVYLKLAFKVKNLHLKSRAGYKTHRQNTVTEMSMKNFQLKLELKALSGLF